MFDQSLESSSLQPVPSIGVPALVVSGFLGAGKTTLIRHLLHEAQACGYRMAVVSNEFGELGIDKAIFGQESNAHYVELEGGCVCCQLSNELLTTLHDLWKLHNPDRIIVETSGVALPFETLVTFWREPVVHWVGEALAVVVVNAEQFVEGRDIEGTTEQQISSADLLVVNKIDLVTEKAVRRVESMLADMAPGTPILHSVNGKVDSAILFPPHPDDEGRLNVRKKRDIIPHTHEQFVAEEIIIKSGISKDSLILQLQKLIALRVKGVVRTSEGIWLVQGVGSRIQLVSPPRDLPKNLIGRIVAIRRI